MSLVSIIITNYNYGKYLDDSISSVLNQTFNNYEIIIVDDGSTDNSLKITKNYLKDPRIKLVKQTNQGNPKAKNRGIVESRSEFIAFLDADDVWLPTKLEKQLALFLNSVVGVVYSRRKWIDPDSNEIPGCEITLHRGKVINKCFRDNFVCFSSAMVRRSFLDEAGYFDEKLPMGNDYDLWIRLAAICNFDYVDEPLVKYRTGHANLSRNTARRYEFAQQIMLKSLASPHISRQLKWYTPSIAWADTWSNIGYYYGKKNMHSHALKYFLKAWGKNPFYVPVWKKFVKYLVKR